MKDFDVTILTDHRYVNPGIRNPYIDNILLEDGLLFDALEKLGLKVHRTNWDNKEFDWTESQSIIFRTTWDYFDRFTEFSLWLEKVSGETMLINSMDIIKWNIDKHYLMDLERLSIPIPPSRFIEIENRKSLEQHCQDSNWDEFILKPAVSGAGRHTYKFGFDQISEHQSVYNDLIKEEAMLLQEYQENIVSEGEIALMLFGGEYSHAILKRAKPGDFRVQDDFGGTVHDYEPKNDIIELAERIIDEIEFDPIYARIDLMMDNDNRWCVSELELIEPELWFRNKKGSADLLAEKIKDQL